MHTIDKNNMLRYISIVLAIILISACRSVNKDPKNLYLDSVMEVPTEVEEQGDEPYIKKARFIFFNMSSPIEMSQIFENSGEDFNINILSDPGRYADYTSSSETALILGLYGVDLSYARMYDQTQLSVRYLASIKKLAEKLGVPEDYVSFSTSRIESNIRNRDSLYNMANEAYLSANQYLKGNERENTASLIILGGWVEAIYIALSILDFEDPDESLLDKIKDQQYSLNSLISILQEQGDDPIIEEYINLLKALHASIRLLDSYAVTRNFEEDNIIEQITQDNSTRITPEKLEAVNKLILQLRNKIIA